MKSSERRENGRRQRFEGEAFTIDGVVFTMTRLANCIYGVSDPLGMSMRVGWVYRLDWATWVGPERCSSWSGLDGYDLAYVTLRTGKG